ncbi:Molybdopterin synthase sulfur carrier subunit [Lophiostoma macrostomum CBS 122681]|uniref:Molybdopterin synthase sulfur carrier subunit n=1 Tax=Lophiostoma macrostomum CBS 122681 TaxID=1314788 RepID=A0A6A6TPP7_9PLEO|nr:Molybdopterin synthase sulfur carrier subunit [Lophiostoma macrostomum CBS 122681]
MAPVKVPSGHFSILYFAAASSFTGKSSEHIAAPLRAGSLFEELEKKYPGMEAKVLASCAVTVNLDYIEIDGGNAPDLDLVIQEGDEVAIIPPVSSG